MTDAEARLLAERIADLWLVPYQRPTFARDVLAEVELLRRNGLYAPPPRPVQPWTTDELGDIPLGIIDPKYARQRR